MFTLDVCDPVSAHNGVRPAARLCAFGKARNGLAETWDSMNPRNVYTGAGSFGPGPIESHPISWPCASVPNTRASQVTRAEVDHV
jgi:hypothetical protein